MLLNRELCQSNYLALLLNFRMYVLHRTRTVKFVLQSEETPHIKIAKQAHLMYLVDTNTPARMAADHWQPQCS